MHRVKSMPHKNEIKVGHKSHHFKGAVVGHVKGQPKSGHGGKKIVPSAT